MRVDKESQVFPFSSASYVYSNYRSKKKPEIMVTTTTCMHPLSTDDVLLSQVLHDTTHRVMYIRRFTQVRLWLLRTYPNPRYIIRNATIAYHAVLNRDLWLYHKHHANSRTAPSSYTTSTLCDAPSYWRTSLQWTKKWGRSHAWRYKVLIIIRHPALLQSILFSALWDL